MHARVQYLHPLSLSCLLLRLISPLWTQVLFSAFPAQHAEELWAPSGMWHAWGWECGKESEQGAWIRCHWLPMLPISCSITLDQAWRQLQPRCGGWTCHLQSCLHVQRGAGPRSHPWVWAHPAAMLVALHPPGDVPSSEMLLHCPAALSAPLLFCSHVRCFPSTTLASFGSVMKVEGSSVRRS